MLKKTIQEFHQKINLSRASDKTSLVDEEILYNQIIENLSIDYETYQENFSYFRSSIEFSGNSALFIGCEQYKTSLNRIIRSGNFYEFDEDILTYHANDELFNNFNIECIKAFNQNSRISSFTIDLSCFNEYEIKWIASNIIHSLEEEGKNPIWSRELIESNTYSLLILRPLLISSNCKELFYHVVSQFLSRIATSSFYQFGRDIIEEIILASYNDNVPELGFFLAFNFYSDIKSVNTAIAFGNICLSLLLKKKNRISEKFITGLILQSMKFYRNVKFNPGLEQLYNTIPSNIKFNNRERHSYILIYLTSLTESSNLRLPNLLFDYLNQERENIIKGGGHDALPWLTLIYNVKRIYNSDNYDSILLDNYLNIFESIVGKERYYELKETIFGDSDNIKKFHKEALLKLELTRNETNFVYDNELAIILSNRLIEYSVKTNDFSSFLTAMILKSDYSLLFKSKEIESVAKFVIPTINADSKEIIYDRVDLFLKALNLPQNEVLYLISYVEGKAYSLSLINQIFNVHSQVDWDHEKLKTLSIEKFFSSFEFDDTKKDKHDCVYVLSPEEHKHDSKKIAEQLSFCKLFIPDHSEALYLVKDMELSLFPHNLFLNQKGDFISQKIPTTNILSTEWFLGINKDFSLQHNYSKSIWNPLDSGDLTLNFMYDKMKDSLTTNSFNVYSELQLIAPLSSDVNIICSHGGSNISEINILSHGENKTYDMDKVIGDGKVLIFFVCHSGSMKSEFFKNSTTSLIKRFIVKGYESVIAPGWALHISVVEFWFPEFMQQLNAGKQISQAVFFANKKVYERFPTPAAWACMHLFGNPYLKIQQQ